MTTSGTDSPRCSTTSPTPNEVMTKWQQRLRRRERIVLLVVIPLPKRHRQPERELDAGESVVQFIGSHGDDEQGIGYHLNVMLDSPPPSSTAAEVTPRFHDGGHHGRSDHTDQGRQSRIHQGLL